MAHPGPPTGIRPRASPSVRQPGLVRPVEPRRGTGSGGRSNAESEADGTGPGLPRFDRGPTVSPGHGPVSDRAPIVEREPASGHLPGNRLPGSVRRDEGQTGRSLRAPARSDRLPDGGFGRTGQPLLPGVPGSGGLDRSLGSPRGTLIPGRHGAARAASAPIPRAAVRGGSVPSAAILGLAATRVDRGRRPSEGLGTGGLGGSGSGSRGPGGLGSGYGGSGSGSSGRERWRSPPPVAARTERPASGGRGAETRTGRGSILAPPFAGRSFATSRSQSGPRRASRLDHAQHQRRHGHRRAFDPVAARSRSAAPAGSGCRWYDRTAGSRRHSRSGIFHETAARRDPPADTACPCADPRARGDNARVRALPSRVRSPHRRRG